ncbi:MAG TPA: methyltransferase domain-containing protein [Pirellulales bacterium]|nr:methyltransferase domain-containing protein [Pirellulales bacterium]
MRNRAGDNDPGCDSTSNGIAAATHVRLPDILSTTTIDTKSIQQGMRPDKQESGDDEMLGCGKAVMRRIHQHAYASHFFVGDGIDIGSGRDPLGQYKNQFPSMRSCREWDLADGDAQLLTGINDNSYEFLHSSHCLEHMHDPVEALHNWFRVIKPFGHMVVLIPDEDLYEQRVWPSRYNEDHKCSFTIDKRRSWSPVSRNLLDLLKTLPETARVVKIELLDGGFLSALSHVDQTTAAYISESAIEFVVRKVNSPD